MTLAICDPDAFYPLRDLVVGPFGDLAQLSAIEQFIRTVVLHDELVMELTPWPQPDDEHEWTDEEMEAGGRNVLTAIGPVLTDFDFFTERLGAGQPETPEINLSHELTDIARQFSNAGEGNVYFKAHIQYLQRIVNIVGQGGSALLASEFGTATLGASTQFPTVLLEEFDHSWQQFAQEVHEGDLGFVVPPVLSIILTRSAMTCPHERVRLLT